LDALRDLIPEGWSVKTRFPDLAVLTEWAVEARYPGDWQEVSEADARSAVQQAEEMLDAVLTDFKVRGSKE